MTKRRLMLGLAVILVATPAMALGLARLVVYDLSRPKPSDIPERSELAGFPVETVTLKASDGVEISGWHVRVPGKKAVILLHGISSSRLQHVPKTELYATLGYSVFSYDARSHGASSGDRVTGGWTERLDLEAAMDYMRGAGNEVVGVDGFSMGAATITFADQEKLKPDFVVLESCYKDVGTLIRNAVARLHLPGFCAEPVLWRIQEKFGLPLSTLSPIAAIAKVTAPTLILLGDSEFQVSRPQADEMLAASAAKVKQLFMFQNAGHDVFSETQPDIYKGQLVAFLAAAGV